MEFKIGDTVKLKEGYCPVMVVSSTDIEFMPDHVECKWYSEKEGKFEFDTFHKDMLKHYKKKGLLDKDGSSA